MTGRESIDSELRAALALLTRIPVRVGPSPTGGAAAFGVVGAFVGSLGAIWIFTVGGVAPLAAAGLALATLALASGGLHLDGLADTFDALAAADIESAERARTDPRVGAAGAIAIAMIVIIDAGLFVSLIERAGVAVAASVCIAAAALARGAAVTLVTFGPPAERGGSSSWFASRTGPWSAITAMSSAALIAIGAALLVDSPAILIGAVIGSAIGLLVAVALVRLRRGIDGDLLGASIEIVFSAVLGVTVVAT